MDRRIRLIALFLVVCFGLLILQLNNLQVHQAASLNAKTSYAAPESQANPFNEDRGEIVTADGVVIAKSQPTNDQYGPLRVFPQGPLYADVTGYYDTTANAAPLGLEDEYFSFLQPHDQTAKTIRQMLTEQSGTDTVVTTINSAIQLAAEQALAPLTSGAVIAIDPQTGAILAMYGKPTFDPNQLAVHNAAQAAKAFAALDPNSGSSPLVNFVTKQTFHPGSTFKILTTSAMFDHMPSLESTIWPSVPNISLPESNLHLQNFNGEVCGGTLANILAKSCDTSYASMGLKLGAPILADEAASFGFNEVPPIDLPADEVSAACFPPVDTAKPSVACGQAQSIGEQNRPGIAYSAIGQQNVTESALEDALVAATIADGGKTMTPHLMARIVSNTGGIVETYTPSVWKQATSVTTATAVLALMRGVANTGTAAGLFSADEHVAAKTGTAETGTSNCSTNWLVATAPADPTDTPTVAVAAVVPFQPGTACDGTGAAVAGPIVKAVLAAALAAQQ